MRMEKSERAELKLNVIKTKIMASSSIISWQTERGKVEVVTDFPFLGSKIIEDDDYSHEIGRHLLLGRKAMTKLDSVLKSRDIGPQRRQNTKELMPSKLVMEKTPESPLDSKEIKPANLFFFFFFLIGG